MDLEAYISRYRGETRFQRLLWIAKMTPDNAVSNQAFQLMESQLKADGNVRRYKEVFGFQTTCDESPEATSYGQQAAQGKFE